MFIIDKKYIGEKFKNYRKQLKYTQEFVAENIDIDEKHYGKIERGLFLPSLETFFKVIEFLQIPLSEFNINNKNKRNAKREKLLKEIYLSSDNELEVYYNILQQIKTIKK